MEVTKNGATAPRMAQVTASLVRDDYVNGRRRYKAYATMMQGPTPVVIAEATLEVPDLEVAKLLHTALGNMLAKQPPEIALVK